VLKDKSLYLGRLLRKKRSFSSRISLSIKIGKRLCLVMDGYKIFSLDILYKTIFFMERKAAF
jgi:hypothetical protein